ncbi:ferritin-like domain-containing protein [Sphingomonas sp. So64.6b]|uniref:ferritin-like domain-containing protein n=1 Tax=Sphingomonas sp. So64.6b TaxID=2997354 RepID=UPI001600E554|nr:ferritin-like domain-containing protein [Sphingomonas sp. So64.6b]QNA85932.1 ferritin-like domain-containing protein [Sphingomonas sp. So64.6b]
MTDTEKLINILEAGETHGAERRVFLRRASGVALAAGASSLLAACGGGDDSTPTPTPTATGTPTPTPTSTSTSTPAATDADVLNFALNLEYLLAQFYQFAANGAGLAATLITGSGTAGAATGGRQVTFTDPLVQQYAKEIAADKLAHVTFLRSVLGTAVAAQPAIDIGVTATSAFSKLAQNAGVVGAGAAFDVYANDANFLLGAFMLADVGVTAYRGGAGLIGSKTYIEAAAGILAAHAYHAGLIRTVLYQKGVATPSLRTDAGKISDARDALDGTGTGADKDQGITGDATTANITPADADGLAFSRTLGQVLNIAYLNPASVVGGGFFTAGLNGTIKTSSLNGVGPTGF